MRNKSSKIRTKLDKQLDDVDVDVTWGKGREKGFLADSKFDVNTFLWFVIQFAKKMKSLKFRIKFEKQLKDVGVDVTRKRLRRKASLRIQILM
jgi:hypothetical protein